MSIISEITDFIFIGEPPQKADMLWIPGTSYPEPTEKAADLWLQGYVPFLLPSGKYGHQKTRFDGALSKKDLYCEDYQTEWEFMFDIARRCGVPAEAILKEDQARTTYENAFKSRAVTDSLGIYPKKAIICCKSFHARRSLMFYTWAYPKTEILVCPVDVQGVSKRDWWKNEYGIERVMGELTRCGSQFKDAIKEYRG